MKYEPEEEGAPAMRILMPLLNAAFAPGNGRAFIAALPDADDRAIAEAEYCYFSGQAEACSRLVEPYLDSHDPSLRLSAGLLAVFSNLPLGHIHVSRFSMAVVREQLAASLNAPDPRERSFALLIATTAQVLLHLPTEDLPPLLDHLPELPGGLKLWACYVLAHKAYLGGNYERALAIADLSVALSPQRFPIAAVYCHLAACMSLMSLRRPEEARLRMEAAWAIAREDGLIQPFAEHHGLLHGLIEVCFKDKPADFKRIIAITYAYSAGWRKIHNADTRREVADNLTTTEFSIAMLYNRGYAAKEIAAHMGLAPRTVTNTIQVIYQKLGISRKAELAQFMLY